MSSIEDVARLAGVSPITASRVVRDQPNVRPETRARVLRAAEELQYIPNAVARNLKRSRTGLIALISTDISDPFFSAVIRGVEDAARATSRMVLLCNSRDDHVLEREFVQTMGEHRVDGMIVAPAPRPMGVLLPPLPKLTPLVLLDQALPGVEADVVRCDATSGVAELTRGLIASGRRRIAIVGGLPGVLTWEERIAGWRQGMSAAGLPAPDDLVVAGDYLPAGGYAATLALMTRGDRPDAIIAANAKAVRGVLDALVDGGWRVPEDVAVASVDDPSPPSRFWATLPVTEPPGYAMGQAAVALLNERLSPAGAAAPFRELVFTAELKP